MKIYSVSFEISGPMAMWTRPDTGTCAVSYPAPTYSAIKGIFESILWLPVQIIPTRVDICSPLIYYNYHTNYNGPLRKSRLVNNDEGCFQRVATVLVDVCYRFYADILPFRKEDKIKLSTKARSWDKRTTSPGHAYKDMFNRMLRQGKCYYMPFLGWKEFVVDYFGPFREDTRVCTEVSVVILSMLREVFSNGYASEKAEFSYDQNVKINQGVLIFPKKDYNNDK